MSLVLDTDEAIELAPRVWWVGMMLPDDRFQCHVYLIEQGDQSVLIDPGSALVASEMIRKVESIVPLTSIRWLVCSHADPDIIGALPALEARGLSPDAAIVTYWRDEALIVHSGTPRPFWRIEEHDWRLDLEDRTLRFVFTPYLHFAGAFATYDETSGTLFSSDLFGGFTEDPSLFATSIEYFDAIRAFHEHYMPSREILAHSLQMIRELPMLRIAPQHGQVIPGELIEPIMEKLEKLECGIYLLARDDPGLSFLLAANQMLHEIVHTLVHEQRFSVVTSYLSEVSTTFLHSNRFELWAAFDGTLVQFDDTDGFAGHVAIASPDVSAALAGRAAPPGNRLIMSLHSPTSSRIDGVMAWSFDEPREIDESTRAVLSQIVGLVEVGLEREILLRSAEFERTTWHSRAIHDTLTGLYNRVSLDDSFTRLLSFDDANDTPRVAVLMIDIDLFKNVNDRFGHPVGDRVLAHVGRSITASVRPTDLAFRFGGEEFLVLLSHVDALTAERAAERIRARVAENPGGDPAVSVSVGVTMRRRAEGPAALLLRADQALYRAKASGRDCVVVDR